MKRANAFALISSAAMAGLLLVASASAQPAQPLQSLCRAEEQVIYSCQFPTKSGVKTGSVCGTDDGLTYRFGKPERVELQITNKPDWSNVHFGAVVGQGGGHQSHIRFSQSNHHYIVLEGENGSLSDTPGHVYSGITVLQGQDGERPLADLDCPSNAVNGTMADASPVIPDQYLDDVTEIENGPFDGWF